MDFSILKEGMTIIYTGKSTDFSGEYEVLDIESTFENNDCPEHAKGRLVICNHIGSDDVPEWVSIDELIDYEWKIKYKEATFEEMLVSNGEVICDHMSVLIRDIPNEVNFREPMMFNKLLEQIGSMFSPEECKTILKTAKWYVIETKEL